MEMELTSSGSESSSAPISDLFAWPFGGDKCHLTSLCACFLCGGGRVNNTVVLYGHLNPLTLPQRAKNKLEPSEQLNPVQSKPWPSAFIQSPDRQARSLVSVDVCLCFCLSMTCFSYSEYFSLFHSCHRHSRLAAQQTGPAQPSSSGAAWGVRRRYDSSQFSTSQSV